MTYHIETYNRLIRSCLTKGEITIEAYRDLEAMNPKTDDETHAAYDVLFQKSKEKQIQDIYARIIKGSEMIDAEKDQTKKRQYIALYEKLLHDLEQLKTS